MAFNSLLLLRVTAVVSVFLCSSNVESEKHILLPGIVFHGQVMSSLQFGILVIGNVYCLGPIISSIFFSQYLVSSEYLIVFIFCPAPHLCYNSSVNFQSCFFSVPMIFSIF